MKGYTPELERKTNTFWLSEIKPVITIFRAGSWQGSSCALRLGTLENGFKYCFINLTVSSIVLHEIGLNLNEF